MVAAQIDAVRTGLLATKQKVRALRQEYLAELKKIQDQSKRYGEKWEDAKTLEIKTKYKGEVRAILQESLPIVDSINAQAEFFTPENLAVHQRLTPAPKPLGFEEASFGGYLSSGDQRLINHINSQQAVLSEMAEDSRRQRIYTDLLTADPKEFSAIVSKAATSGDAVTLCYAKRAQRSRAFRDDSEKTQISSALIDAEGSFQLGAEDYAVFSAVKECAQLGRQIESTAEAIRFDRDDIAEKVEGVETRVQ
jgi:hypothetical protein